MKTAKPPSVTSGQFYCGLVTANFYETWAFYTEYLDFRTWSETDDMVLLVHESGARLGIMRHEKNERHSELVSATDGRGLWFNLDVSDLDAVYKRLRAAGVPVVQPLEAEPRSVRFFVVRDPCGVLIRIAVAEAASVVWDAEPGGGNPMGEAGLGKLQLGFMK
jgi:uncharacterized glyoxalase superfamily protein PhnB